MPNNEFGPCAKQVVTAVLVAKNGKHYHGSNDCATPQTICPRNTQGFAPGEGYHLCKAVCNQIGHAEEMAVARAGDDAIGATVYVYGHPQVIAATGTGVCGNCSAILKRVQAHGVIVDPTNPGDAPENPGRK